MRRSNYDSGEVMNPEPGRTEITLRRFGSVIGYVFTAALIAVGAMAALYGAELKRCEQSGGTFVYNVDKKNECVIVQRRK